MLSMDFEMGHFLRTQVIPRAVLYYTGDALDDSDDDYDVRLLLTCKHKIDPHTHPNPLCPLCKIHDHDTTHLFNCTHIPTHLTPTDLWKNPVEAEALLEVWALRLADL